MVRPTPARLYKYQSLSARSLTALKTRTLWFGRPSRLNDPFDCSVPLRFAPVTLADCERLLASKVDGGWARLHEDTTLVDSAGRPTEALRRMVEETGQKAIRELTETNYFQRGVTCFSEAPDSTLLWSHYAEGHHGICLEFDTASPLLNPIYPIRYTDAIPEMNIVEQLLGGTEQVLSGLLTKAACWAYEREWRAIHKTADTEYCYGIEALTGVYLGAALSEAELDLIAHVLHGTPVRLYRLTRSESSFALEIHPVTYTPYRYRPPSAV
jgi:hypothetical protein